MEQSVVFLSYGPVHDGRAIDRGHVTRVPYESFADASAGVRNVQPNPYLSWVRWCTSDAEDEAAEAYALTWEGTWYFGIGHNSDDFAIRTIGRTGVFVVQGPIPNITFRLNRLNVGRFPEIRSPVETGNF
jgi:hypothetical protein